MANRGEPRYCGHLFRQWLNEARCPHRIRPEHFDEAGPRQAETVPSMKNAERAPRKMARTQRKNTQ